MSNLFVNGVFFASRAGMIFCKDGDVFVLMWGSSLCVSVVTVNVW